MKKVLLTAVSAIALMTATHAASPFSGFYLGAGLGLNAHKKTDKMNTTTNPTVSIWNKSSSASTVSFLTYMGYGTVFGNGMYLGGEFTLGHEGAAKFGEVKNDPINGPIAPNDLRTTNRSKSGFTGEIAARIGYVFCNKTLVYGKLGFGWSPKMTTEYNLNNVKETKSFSNRGVVIGAGVEHAITNNWLIRGEYKYRFGNKHTIKDATDGVKQEIKTSAHTVMLGVAYKF